MSNEMKTTLQKSLKDRAKEFSVRLPFMEGRDKGDVKELVGTVSTINEYGFLPGENAESYAVFTVAERGKTFYFAGEVLTDRLAQLEAEGYHAAIVEEGLPILMTEKKSKNNRTYINVEFYPE